ncbi:DUF3566 domain-containing protein [Planotetraspora kaengkrachanensis]|uniref:DUF3566 domain-containing protein n=1 Tax=Planotetraspora kaengkrachanensis TaxID=575193 RepID=A0A8J3PU48_9ACTN|nr:DUF3566 domain-containing protein [Planotetraspora kaengkrachanensis]GIG81098.1 hypothetical protein Pka01_42250 [Planotetraspora kaengkrachanensis]
MSDSGGARATGAARKKSPGARPASSSMRDGVTERVDKDANVVEVASEKEDVTPAGKSESDSDNATVRIRTSAADQPWKKQSSKDGEKPAADRQPAPDQTAPFAKPSLATPSAASPAERGGPAGGSTGAKPVKNESATPGASSGPGSGIGKSRPGGDKPFGGKPDSGAAPKGGAPGSGASMPPATSASSGPTASFPRPTPSPGDGSRPGVTPAAGAPSPPPPVSAASPVAPAAAGPAQDASLRGSAFGMAERPKDASIVTPKGKGKKSDAKGPRKAHLVLRRIEPWSAMKFSFVISIVCFVILFVAVAILYGVLSGIGVFSSITDAVTQLTTGDTKTASTLDISSWFAPGRILGYAGLLGAINVVLITALSTLGAVIYNVCAEFVGGIEVTFSEAE